MFLLDTGALIQETDFGRARASVVVASSSSFVVLIAF